jgi:hypothetical protein
MREASAYQPDQIITSSVRDAAIYQPEPAAAGVITLKRPISRQLEDWEEVVKLGDTAFKMEDHPNNPMERFVFIEGYAHVGDWERAIKLSRESYQVSKDYVGPLLCQLWDRIETETSSNSTEERSQALSEVKNIFACKS